VNPTPGRSTVGGIRNAGVVFVAGFFQLGFPWIYCEIFPLGIDYQESATTVDGRNPVNSPVEVGSFPHYLQGLIHPRWSWISSINSISKIS